MIRQQVMKYNSRRYAKGKQNQQSCGYNFFYVLVLKQSLFFATTLQIYNLLHYAEIFVQQLLDSIDVFDEK